MKFNDTTSKTGMIQECETLLGMDDGHISGNATRLKIFTRLINGRYRQVNSWIWQATGTWEYDDSNYTNLPIATTDLVNDQQDYEIPSTAQKIDRVEIKDTHGEWTTLDPIDKAQIKTAMGEFLETAGIPLYYDVLGRSLVLYPKPDTAQTGVDDSLKLYFSRNISEFSSTDTSTEPGFVEDFHRLLPLGASLDYAIGYNLSEKIPNLQRELLLTKEDLQKFYGARHRDMKPRIQPYDTDTI